MPEELKRPNPKPVKPSSSSKSDTLVSATTPVSNAATLTNPRELERSRASEAWRWVQSVKSQPYQAKYGGLARKMPTLIQVNGLAQTLAYLEAKGQRNNADPKKRKQQFIQMFDHLSSWICNNRYRKGTGNLLQRVLEMSSQDYRMVTNEALAFLQWLKRFSEAELGNEEDN